MRGAFEDQGRLFSYISPEQRVAARHPLRTIRELVREVLSEMDRDFRKLYSTTGRPSIPPEQLLSALLLQVFYGVRSERQLMEQLDYNLLYRWFVGLSPDDAVWDATTFTMCSIASWRSCCITKMSRHCCRTSISPSTAR
jgi:transposase